MGRICPFLALGDDLRTAIDGFDAEHRCGALEDVPAVDRPRQLQFCLRDEHTECERYVERLAAINEQRRGNPVTPDARFLSTRLVLEMEPRWRRRSAAQSRSALNARVAAGGAALALVTGIAAASTNTFGLLPRAREDSRAADPPGGTTSPSPSASEAERLFVAATPSPPAPSPSPRQSKSATPATPAPTPRVYVVQSGDTLDAIAVRYGTTISAIMAANGLGSDLINVGQVLVIP